MRTLKLLAPFVVLLATAPVAEDQWGRAAQVPNKIAFKAHAFPLEEVRLLDGPWRDAMVRDEKYLLELEPDRLLHMFRVTAGLPSMAGPYTQGWETPTTELRGHTVGHYLGAIPRRSADRRAAAGGAPD
jgi:DUF1680 family protein